MKFKIIYYFLMILFVIGIIGCAETGSVSSNVKYTSVEESYKNITIPMIKETDLSENLSYLPVENQYIDITIPMVKEEDLD
jgi:hypothetical protein